jgi:putative acetyltransferase
VIELRRARAGDVEWLLELYADADVEPYMSGRGAQDAEALAAEVERSEREPERFGRMVIELDGERAGALGYEQVSERHRIARLGGLAVHPDFRGRRLADAAARLVQRYLLVDCGYHRLELACYAFNERAITHAERSGFVREGVKRRAYLRHGEWQDAVQFALLADELDAG